MVVGYAMERVAYRPLRDAPRLAPLITAIGVSIILQHLALLVWSRNILAFPQIIKSRVTYDVGGAAITNVQIAIIVISRRDDGGARAAGVPHAARHRDARDGAEPAGRRADGHGHQPRDRRSRSSSARRWARSPA